MPEFDRLYLDMNGIIHCSSHNNSEEELEKQQQQAEIKPGDENNGNGGGVAVATSASPPIFGVPPITEEQIFQNVCYYVDRVVSDIVQPKKVVFLAIDGVAPRAKLNQQRSRRYRSGTEQEIEKHLMTLQRVQGGGVDGEDEDVISKEYLIEADGGAFDRYRSPTVGDSGNPRGAQRFSGTIDTASSSNASISTNPLGGLSSENEDGVTGFHSNCITPGTPFLHRCSQHILSFLRHKLQADPRWRDLTIVFSGHDVPGEGEHKIMEFIRHEKHKLGYDPNTSHCIFGQDGDLVMLGLAMHEPHTCLLREEVVFDPVRRKAIEKLAKLENHSGTSPPTLHTPVTSDDVVRSLNFAGDDINGHYDGETATASSVSENHHQPPLSGAVQSYIHNANFELLHISLLREYLGLEFETAEFYPNSRYQLEPTIDDFVFMTFFVGNDFLPHMPALDIGDEAFDLLFYAYKKNRGKWLKDGLYHRSVASTANIEEGNQNFKNVNHPYLTDAGTITSGKSHSPLRGHLFLFSRPGFIFF
jgi:5'-3' exonuclease